MKCNDNQVAVFLEERLSLTPQNGLQYQQDNLFHSPILVENQGLPKIVHSSIYLIFEFEKIFN